MTAAAVVAAVKLQAHLIPENAGTPEWKAELWQCKGRREQHMKQMLGSGQQRTLRTSLPTRKRRRGCLGEGHH